MLQTGTVLQGRFLIEQELARGGMGAVYLAIDQKFGSRVAIKERFYEDKELAAAFEREARILNSLHHPILPHVSDYFSEGAGHFLVMEFIEGEDLSEVLKRQGAFTLDEVVRWTLELLDGLDYLHSQDPPIIHRDIKPGNLKLTSRGNIVLLDFGLAKETSAGIEGVRSVFGYSRRYSPLEQIEGAGTDARSDIFSLAATVFHLLTGEPPADVIARASAIVAGRKDPIRLASDLKAEVPVALSHVIDQALSLDPEKRFASASLMRTAVEEALASNQSAAQVSAVEEETEIAPKHDGARIQSFPELEAYEQALASKVAVPVTATSLPQSPAPNTIEPKNKKPRIAVSRPFLQRPAYLTALVATALMVLAYAGYRSNRDAAVSQSPEPQNASQVVEPSPSIEVKEADETSVQPAAEPAVEPAPANPIDNDTIISKAEKNKSSRTKAKSKEPRMEPEEDPAEPDVRSRPQTIARSRTTTRQARRVRTRRVYDDEPPASSIETIFTGLPRRRHWRPYF